MSLRSRATRESLSLSFSLSFSLSLSFGSLDRPRLNLLRKAFMMEEKGVRIDDLLSATATSSFPDVDNKLYNQVGKRTCSLHIRRNICPPSRTPSSATPSTSPSPTTVTVTVPLSGSARRYSPCIYPNFPFRNRDARGPWSWAAASASRRTYVAFA